MSHAKFVLLQEPIAASEASNLLCRVVASKTAPLMAAAPFLRSPGADSSHSTPGAAAVVPKCSAPIRLADFMAMARSQGVAAHVARLLDGPRLLRMDDQQQQQQQHGVLLECRLVRRYVVADPATAFYALMHAPDDGGRYARDVRALLEQCADRQGYFLTGVLTATDDAWLVGATQQELRQFDMYADGSSTLPFLYQDLLGGPPEMAAFAHHQQPKQMPREHIFAASYRVARIPRGASSPASPESAPGQRSPGSTPPGRPRRPKRSNGYHLAPRRAEEPWPTSNGSSPETAPYYDDSVRLDDDDGLGLQMEEAPFIMV